MNSLNRFASNKVPSSAQLAILCLLLCCASSRAQSQSSYIKASNTDSWDEFGVVMAMSVDTLVIGAPTEGSASTGVNGNQADNSAYASGAAYVFVRSGTSWTQQAYLKASNTDSMDTFGGAVAIFGDTIVIGAPWESSNATGVNGNQGDNSISAAGAAYVFVRAGTTWTQQAYLKASYPGVDNFGSAVSISGDTIVVGAYSESSNATGVNGNPADASAPNAGAAYVFVRNGTSWTQQAYLKASNTDAEDDFGSAVTIDGNTVLIGAHGEDSNAVGVNGNSLDNSAFDAGATYVFVRNGATWTQQAYLKASNAGSSDQFGTSVALSGNTAVIGAHGEDSNATGANGNENDNGSANSGAAYVFVLTGTTWTQQAYLKASNTDAADQFGISVALFGDRLVVGAIGEDSNSTGVNGNQSNNTATDSGAAYVFVRSGPAWSQEAYLKGSNTERFDQFGLGACVSAGSVVVGAYAEASNATGVNGNQGDNSSMWAGAAYAFDFGPLPSSYCYGDGSGTACPCGNAGVVGRGCANSVSVGGAVLSASGMASIANDSFVLAGIAMPNSSALYFQGTAEVNAGAGVVFGDGLRCTGGSIVRLGTETNVAGASIYPIGNQLAVSIKGQISSPDIRTYQCWYRNPALFCTPSTFNLTNGLSVTWVP